MSVDEPARDAAVEPELAPEELARVIAGIVDDKLGDEIARNARQAKAIHDEVRERMKRDHGRLPAAVEGEIEARWVLMDYLDCVLHVFVPELRERYRLEILWGEAPRIEL